MAAATPRGDLPLTYRVLRAILTLWLKLTNWSKGQKVPRAFTEAERETIRERLIAAGRGLFSRYGLKKTTVEEIARRAGVAKGTFYLFFPSKEALYAEVLLREAPQMMRKLIAESFAATDDVREAIVRYLKGLVKLIETNELVKDLVSDPYTQSLLLEALDLPELQSSSPKLFSPLLDVIAKAQKDGKIVEGDPLEIAQMFGVIKVLPLYKDQIPPEQYPRLVDRLAQVIADGLTCPAKINPGLDLAMDFSREKETA